MRHPQGSPFYEPNPEVRRTRARAAAEIQRIILERFPHRREELLQRSADYEHAVSYTHLTLPTNREV